MKTPGGREEATRRPAEAVGTTARPSWPWRPSSGWMTGGRRLEGAGGLSASGGRPRPGAAAWPRRRSACGRLSPGQRPRSGRRQTLADLLAHAPATPTGPAVSPRPRREPLPEGASVGFGVREQQGAASCTEPMAPEATLPWPPLANHYWAARGKGPLPLPHAQRRHKEAWTVLRSTWRGKPIAGRGGGACAFTPGPPPEGHGQPPKAVPDAPQARGQALQDDSRRAEPRRAAGGTPFLGAFRAGGEIATPTGLWVSPGGFGAA